MASSPSSENLSLTNRLRSWIERHRGEAAFGHEPPQRKGFVITVCIVISLFLWFALTVQEIYTVQFEMPTEIVNLPADMALKQLPPKTVQVQVRGEGLELLQLRYNPVIIPIDVSQEQISLDQATPEFSQNVILENVSPRVFNLEKETRIERRIPIQLRADIRTSGKHDLIDAPSISPDSVIVSGARSIISELKYWPTERVTFEGLQDSIVTQVELSDTLDGLVRKSTAQITLRAYADEFTEDTRTIDVMVTKMPTTQRFVTLDPSTIRVTYRVPLSEFERARAAQDFFATVDYDMIREDTTGRVVPKLNLPDNLTLRNVRMIPDVLGYYEVLMDE